MLRYLPLLGVIMLAASAVAGASEDSDQQLQQRIAELEQQVSALEEIVSGTAHPINLGRTSLARVTASSVNGSRAMDNIYYGIVNAFDGGDNWYNNLNYTYWLPDYYPSSWADVYFDQPVSLTRICVEGEPPFVTTLYFAKGGEEKYVQVSGELEFATVIHGVTRVRLSFKPEAAGLNRVDEISIYGIVPPGIEYTVGRPCVYVTIREATTSANAAYAEWWSQFRDTIEAPLVTEDVDSFVFIYSSKAVDILRVTIDKLTGQTTSEELAEFVSREPEANPVGEEADLAP